MPRKSITLKEKEKCSAQGGKIERSQEQVWNANQRKLYLAAQEKGRKG